MSTLKVDGIRSNSASSDAITLAGDGTCTANITNNLSNRNLIINGDMQIWQRSTSVSVVDAGDEGYQSVDRYYNSYVGAANGVYTISKSTEAPDGFGSSIKYDVTTVNSNVSSGGNKVIYIYQDIEAQNIYNSGWKQTSTSNYLTFSFWFKTNKSGTNKLPIFFQEGDNSYSYVTDITVSDTNWNRYSLTVPGNAGLSIPNDNGTGLKVGMAFAVGDGFQTTADQWNNSREYGTSNSTNWLDNTSNEWYTTGWQVEVGDHETDFEHRSYAQELALCQRYFQKYSHGTYRGIGGFHGRKSGSGTVVGTMYGFPPMRAAATSSVNNAAAFRTFRYTDAGTSTPSAVVVTHEGEPFTDLKWTLTLSDYSTGQFVGMFTTTNSGELELDAEL